MGCDTDVSDVRDQVSRILRRADKVEADKVEARRPDMILLSGVSSVLLSQISS